MPNWCKALNGVWICVCVLSKSISILNKEQGKQTTEADNKNQTSALGKV